MFPQRLRLARKRAGLSLRGLAERMGGEVTHQAIKSPRLLRASIGRVARFSHVEPS